MNTDTSQSYFNTVLYARAYINEIKIITPAKGPKYGAVNASILDQIGGKTIYRTVDTVISGQKSKEFLCSLRERWPQNRMNHKGPKWVADINVGSLRAESYRKKNGDIGAVLKGRLINIRNLQIGEEKILGEITPEIPPPVLVAPGYINLLNPTEKVIRFAMLEGKVDEPETRNVNIGLTTEIDAINQLVARELCPKGYQHRATNPKIFATLEIANFHCEGFAGKDGAPAVALKGNLAAVRYLKANDEIIVGKKQNAA